MLRKVKNVVYYGIYLKKWYRVEAIYKNVT